MPRCYACDANLSNYEATRKIIQPDGKAHYPDLCNKCYSSTDLASFTQVIERHDLSTDTLNEDLDPLEE